jgi:hypothetical protein
MSLWFSAVFPVGYFYSCLACFFNFWVDKFCVLRLFKMKPPADDKLVVVTRTFVAFIILIHSVVTAHFYYSWPFSNLCRTGTKLSELGLSNAALLGASTDQVYVGCDTTSSSLLPPTVKEPWFQDGGAQYGLVAFYNVVSVIFVVLIFVGYVGGDAAVGIYGLFFFRHSSSGDVAKDQDGNPFKYETVESGEGYVPQFNVPGLDHAVTACVAANESDCGGLDFQTYLMNWTASLEPTGNENPKEPSLEEQDAIYKEYNVYFDEQLSQVDDKNKKTCLLSHARQYIKNSATQEAGMMRMSIVGKAKAGIEHKARRNSRCGDEVEEERPSVSNRLKDRAAAFLPKFSSNPIIEKPATQSDLKMMASASVVEDDDSRRGTTQYPASMSGGY